MIRDVVANVGGDCAEVDALMGPGIDPHLYRASAGDVRKLRNADVIFYGGYSLEGKLGRIFGRLENRIPTVAVSEAAHEPDTLIAGGKGYAIDPHLWMDASLWAGTVPVIADALIKQQSHCRQAIEANAADYKRQLEALDGWIDEAIATIPEDHRYLVTAHDAFAYYGRAYAINVVGIQGISTDSEAGVGDIRATADKVAKTGVPAIFVESTINPRTVEAVVNATRERGHEVEVGGELYSDAMGAEGSPSGTYIGMLHANTRTVVEALGGETPPLPEALHPWAENWGIR
jgi:manganese/zinc/iron transport system substrate-binding protein